MRLRAIKAKHWALRYYLLISCILLFLAFTGMMLIKPQNWQEAAAILGAPFVFFITLQKQKTEELQLFAALFEKFNNRYDELNEVLNALAAEEENAPLTSDQQNALFNYFNLCAEEWFYYSQGYIYPEVWRAWENGMRHFFNHPRVQHLWKNDPGKDSYYGFVPPFNESKTNKNDR
jgi:hypothetical protein